MWRPIKVQPQTWQMSQNLRNQNLVLKFAQRTIRKIQTILTIKKSSKLDKFAIEVNNSYCSWWSLNVKVSPRKQVSKLDGGGRGGICLPHTISLWIQGNL